MRAIIPWVALSVIVLWAKTVSAAPDAVIEQEGDKGESKLWYEGGVKTHTGLDSVGIGRTFGYGQVGYRLLGEYPLHLDVIGRTGVSLAHEESGERGDFGVYGMMGARVASDTGRAKKWLALGPAVLYDGTPRRIFGFEARAGFCECPMGPFIGEGSVDTITFFDDFAVQAQVAMMFFHYELGPDLHFETGLAYGYDGYARNATYKNQHGFGPKFKFTGGGLEMVIAPMITIRPLGGPESYLFLHPEVEIRKSF